MALFALAGCSGIKNALENVGNTAEPISATDAPENTTAPSPEPDPNPVFTLLGDFISDFEKASRGLFDAVYESEDEEKRDELFALLRNEALAASLRPTVGMLPVDGDSGLFGGSVTGPYAGTGSINAAGVFSYSFENGESISGALEEDLLRAETHGGEEASLRLSKTGDGWLLVVIRGETAEYLEITGARIRFVTAPLSPDSEDEFVFPDTSGAFVCENGVLEP